MSTGRSIYLKLCEAPDLAAAAAQLSCDDLAEAARYVARLRGKGISAQVWGVIQDALSEKGAKK